MEGGWWAAGTHAEHTLAMHGIPDFKAPQARTVLVQR